MSLKLKIVFVILLAAAGFFIVRIGLYFDKSVKNAASATINSQFLPAEKKNFSKIDSDKDGIPDIDESYYRTNPFNPDTDQDGYLDGEEIAIGCDPTIPRPNDCSNINGNKNLTDMVSNLMAGGLYSGDLKNPRGNENFQENLDKIKLKVYLDFENSFANKISISDLKKIDDNNLPAVNDYLNKVAEILNKTILRPQQEQIDEIKSALNIYLIAPREKNPIFEKLYNLFDQSANNLVDLSVPSSWTDLHFRLINSMNRFATTYKYISDPSTDPIASILAFEKLVNEFNTAQSILNEYRVRAEKIK
jgi:hypothetical protein